MTDQKDDLLPCLTNDDFPTSVFVVQSSGEILGEWVGEAYTVAQNSGAEVEYTRTDIAEARVALAIKLAAEVCKRQEVYSGLEAESSGDEWWHGSVRSAQECYKAILALPHDPEALEAYVREVVIPEATATGIGVYVYLAGTRKLVGVFPSIADIPYDIDLTHARS